MHSRNELKIYTLRHWLFYAAILAVLAIATAVAHSAMNWSDGLTFAVAVVAAGFTCTMALREDLFGPVSAHREQRDRRA